MRSMSPSTSSSRERAEDSSLIKSKRALCRHQSLLGPVLSGKLIPTVRGGSLCQYCTLLSTPRGPLSIKCQQPQLQLTCCLAEVWHSIECSTHTSSLHANAQTSPCRQALLPRSPGTKQAQKGAKLYVSKLLPGGVCLSPSDLCSALLDTSDSLGSLPASCCVLLTSLQA